MITLPEAKNEPARAIVAPNGVVIGLGNSIINSLVSNHFPSNKGLAMVTFWRSQYR